MELQPLCLLSLVLAVCSYKNVRQKHNQTQEGDGQHDCRGGPANMHRMSTFFHMTEF